MANQFNGFRATKPVVRLIDPVNGFYEVFFIVYDSAGKKHQMRYKAGINSLPKGERKSQAIADAQTLWEALQNKWNPLQEKYPAMEKLGLQSTHRLTLFPEALDFALAVKKNVLSKYSMYDYNGCARFMKAAAAKTGHLSEKITDIKKRDVRAIIGEAKELNSWSNKARNKYLTIFRSLLTVLEDHEMIDFNPASKIKMEPEEESLGYRRLTDDEKDRIANHLLLQAPDYFDYLMFIYDDGIRRKETLMLKIGDFNLTRKEIIIQPEVAKTNKGRIVPITDTIMNVLMNRDIWNYPADYYLFSNDKFRPGPVAYHPNTPTNWWREMIIDPKTGLGIDCKMYSLKHKGADDKIMADIDIDALRNLYGHRSQQMTEGYARAVKGKYKQQIIDKAPVFAKVISMKRSAK